MRLRKFLLKTTHNLYVVCAALVLGTALLGWSRRPQDNAAQATSNFKWVKAPEFEGTKNQWLNSNGKQVTLSSRRGKVTIVEFSTSQNSNLPAYKTWATKWQGRGVEVVGVYTPESTSERSAGSVASNLRENSVSFPVLLDTNRANWNRWQQRSSPTIYILDGDGYIRFKREGELEDKGTAQVEQQVENILAESATPGKVVKTEAQWKQSLAPQAFQVLRHADTEAPFTGALWNNHEKGTYLCAGCGLELFSSATKFESGTGWPSFFQPLNKKAVEEKSDSTLGMERTEVLCARCGGHLGHVFDDGPKPTGLRYCMNSAALSFQKADK